MSIKLQDEPIPEGAKQVLSTDADNGRTRGGDFNQNSMADCVRGPNAEVGQPRAVVTGANHLEGSNKGDHRTPDVDTANAMLEAVSGSNKPPRGQVRQTIAGRHIESNITAAPEVGD